MSNLTQLQNLVLIGEYEFRSCLSRSMLILLLAFSNVAFCQYDTVWMSRISIYGGPCVYKAPKIDSGRYFLHRNWNANLDYQIRVETGTVITAGVSVCGANYLISSVLPHSDSIITGKRTNHFSMYASIGYQYINTKRINLLIAIGYEGGTLIQGREVTFGLFPGSQSGRIFSSAVSGVLLYNVASLRITQRVQLGLNTSSRFMIDRFIVEKIPQRYVLLNCGLGFSVIL